MPYLETDDGVELFYRDWGTGKPVVLIHGWPVNGEMWEQQATYLAEHGLRVITYDRRGFGRSGQPWTGYDYDTLAADLNAVMEELELEGVTLVGFSMAGGEVVRYLSEYGSDRVERAVLLASVTPYLLKTADNPGGVDGNVFDQMEQQIRDDRPTFLKEFALRFFGRTTLKHTVSEPELEHNQIMALTGSPRSTLALMKAWSTTDFREEMKAITIPVLVIHGTNDATVPIDLSGRLSAKLLPNATLSEYEGEPHGLYLTAADRINRELLQFIGGGTEPISAPVLA
ncbi:alpha/beta hydrolase [Granulicella sp. dw_53]|uniref:alpha/beta fold hydrolase n=1 Tax=Granulicella sp. dw_53 TaxID=2719792 RepID=UPI001BD1EDC2|nr:alpha/beta hydrolase [Granulicella sp. dw_53]